MRANLRQPKVEMGRQIMKLLVFLLAFSLVLVISSRFYSRITKGPAFQPLSEDGYKMKLNVVMPFLFFCFRSAPLRWIYLKLAIFELLLLLSIIFSVIFIEFAVVEAELIFFGGE